MLRFEREIRDAISIIYTIIDNPPTEGFTALTFAPMAPLVVPGTAPTVGPGLAPTILRIPAGAPLAVGATLLYEGGKKFLESGQQLGALDTMELVMRSLDTLTRTKKSYCEDCVRRSRWPKHGNP